MCQHYIADTKKLLLDTISDMSQNLSLFVVNPTRDFTRNRKINFESFIKGREF